MTLRRTLQRSLSTTTRGLLQFGSGGVAPPSYDTDAQAYITAVEAADGQSLETGVKDAINAFVVGCKADGIWTAIKASCILAGARTLTGALVPLVGAAPTNNNFVSGDYSRTAGLTGDGSTKYLDSNRSRSADPQNDFHASVYITSAATTGVALGADTLSNRTSLYIDSTLSIRAALVYNLSSSPSFALGFLGGSRASSSSFSGRTAGLTESFSATSVTPTAVNLPVLARNLSGTVGNFCDGTIAFYSIGESLDLALLDSRVTTLITSIGTALA